MHILHNIKKNVDNLSWLVDQDFRLVEEVSSWARDLESLKTIKSQEYIMLMALYSGDELDKIDDLMENIKKGNKVMLSLYGVIEKIEDINLLEPQEVASLINKFKKESGDIILV